MRNRQIENHCGVLLSTKTLNSRDFAQAISDAAHSGRPISDAAAKTIASWWQSPGRVGRVMASLACSIPVDIDALCEDVDDTLASVDMQMSDRENLMSLQEWARQP